ncbi:phosphatidylinositide phosphatase sac1 [Anaeramoeba flamelloides]|uniref:Phosphatidylinositide phosphatase sac1 n=1 Tax=Anaeramoeba flamelloides TaxID=1746091 RepID=A0AAV7ZQD7_9EUKA|nr:phosphatidylinositide phosphatase sac1 [Anaeramoeba flamelloides]
MNTAPFVLITDPEAYYLKDLKNKKTMLRIDRTNSGLEEVELTNDTTSKPAPIYGVLGIIKLILGDYLIFVTQIKTAGVLFNKLVYTITKTQIVPLFSKSEKKSTPFQEKEEKFNLEQLSQFLNSGNLIFSYEYDLTNSRARLSTIHKKLAEQNNNENETNHKSVSNFPGLSNCFTKYLYNHSIAKSFLNLQHCWVLIVIVGFFKSKVCELNSKKFRFTLVSRRFNKRPGRRYIRRGIDVEGNCVNFVETEQIIEYYPDHAPKTLREILMEKKNEKQEEEEEEEKKEKTTRCTSYIQTRGSIPAFWSQFINLKYKPKMVLTDVEDEVRETAFERHFETQYAQYGNQVAISLIDTKGGEKVIGDEFGRLVDQYNKKQKEEKQKIRYIVFDFHKECSKMRWYNLKKLMDQINEDIDDYSYYADKFNSTDLQIQKQQTGTFRTNCIDCLDRTNVVQSLIERRTLNDQLIFLNILGSEEKFETNQAFEFYFKNLWADHADAISKSYSGTPALKTDFTRTGKRTFKGLLNDGKNSVKRYYINNFKDGQNQDNLDTLLGNCDFETIELKPRWDWKQKTIWSLLMIFWLLVLIFSFGKINKDVVYKHAKKSLNIPRLVKNDIGYTKKEKKIEEEKENEKEEEEKENEKEKEKEKEEEEEEEVIQVENEN